MRIYLVFTGLLLRKSFFLMVVSNDLLQHFLFHVYCSFIRKHIFSGIFATIEGMTVSIESFSQTDSDHLKKRLPDHFSQDGYDFIGRLS